MNGLLKETKILRMTTEGSVEKWKNMAKGCPVRSLLCENSRTKKREFSVLDQRKFEFGRTGPRIASFFRKYCFLVKFPIVATF